jgi:glutathione S-transferase
MGINFTLADILIIPWFFRSCIFEKLFDITIHSQFPKIISWINNVSERNSAKVTKQAC